MAPQTNYVERHSLLWFAKRISLLPCMVILLRLCRPQPYMYNWTLLLSLRLLMSSLWVPATYTQQANMQGNCGSLGHTVQVQPTTPQSIFPSCLVWSFYLDYAVHSPIYVQLDAPSQPPAAYELLMSSCYLYTTSYHARHLWFTGPYCTHASAAHHTSKRISLLPCMVILLRLCRPQPYNYVQLDAPSQPPAAYELLLLIHNKLP